MKKFILLFAWLTLSFSVLAQDQNLMSGKYPVTELQKVLIPHAEWAPFPRLNDRAGWAKADQGIMNAYIKAAESYLDFDWPTLPATLSLLIVRTGNRSEYEAISFRKRSVLGTLILAEVAENKGRFIDQIVNGIWSICEESWWGVPACLPNTKELSGLMDISKPFVCLFGAETGTFLAWADYFFGEKFDAISPQIRKRIYNEINYRLMEPLMNQRHWWMYRTADGRGPNNWNPWICSNWMNFVLLIEKDDARRAEMIGRLLTVLDEFINPYPQDGGCDEGPSYWGVAAASLYDNVSMLNLASRDAFRYVYDDERFRNMGRFIYRAQISENYFLNFADANPNPGVSATMVYRFGTDIHDKNMMDFGAWYRRPEASGRVGSSTYFRNLFALFMQDELQKADQRLPLPKDVWMSDVQIMATRDSEGTSNGFYLAAKGGHNDESHNHNDIGNFVVFYDGQPLLIDVGRGTYTAKTFGNRRYDIWYNCSDYHNLPTINGVTQSPGLKYQASNVNYKSGKATVEFTLDIAKAYPPEAQVNGWKRTILLNRGKSVQWKDVVDLEKAESVTQHLMTCYPGEVTKAGELVIHYKPKDGKAVDFAIKYDARQFKASIEKVKLETEEDNGIRSGWGDVIHRINFELLSPKKKDTYVFEVVKK